jgi:hypothetical protein
MILYVLHNNTPARYMNLHDTMHSSHRARHHLLTQYSLLHITLCTTQYTLYITPDKLHQRTYMTPCTPPLLHTLLHTLLHITTHITTPCTPRHSSNLTSAYATTCLTPRMTSLKSSAPVYALYK